jgi:hypothetical protein
MKKEEGMKKKVNRIKWTSAMCVLCVVGQSSFPGLYPGTLFRFNLGMLGVCRPHPSREFRENPGTTSSYSGTRRASFWYVRQPAVRFTVL